MGKSGGLFIFKPAMRIMGLNVGGRMSDEKDPVLALEAAMGSTEPSPEEEVKEEEVEVEADPEEQPEEETPEVESKEEELVSKDELEKEIKGRVKLRGKLRDAKQRIAELESELHSLKQPDGPRLEDFETIEDYEAAVSAAQNAGATPVEFVAARDSILEQHEDWDDAPEDWMEVVSRDPKDGGVPFSEDMIIMVADLDEPASVMYELAKNPEAYARISGKRSKEMKALALKEFANSLDARQPAASANRMSGQLTKKPKVAPIDPVGGGSRGQTSIDSLDVADHIKIVRSSNRF
jgi:hypothetical protein